MAKVVKRVSAAFKNVRSNSNSHDNVYDAVIVAVHCHCKSSPGSSDECSTQWRSVVVNVLSGGLNAVLCGKPSPGGLNAVLCGKPGPGGLNAVLCGKPGPGGLNAVLWSKPGLGGCNSKQKNMRALDGDHSFVFNRNWWLINHYFWHVGAVNCNPK